MVWGGVRDSRERFWGAGCDPPPHTHTLPHAADGAGAQSGAGSGAGQTPASCHRLQRLPDPLQLRGETLPQNLGTPPPICTHTRGPAPLWAAVAASWGCFSAESRIHGMSVSPGCPQSGGPWGAPCPWGVPRVGVPYHKSIPCLQHGHLWGIPCPQVVVSMGWGPSIGCHRDVPHLLGCVGASLGTVSPK